MGVRRDIKRRGEGKWVAIGGRLVLLEELVFSDKLCRQESFKGKKGLLLPRQSSEGCSTVIEQTMRAQTRLLKKDWADPAHSLEISEGLWLNVGSYRCSGTLPALGWRAPASRRAAIFLTIWSSFTTQLACPLEERCSSKCRGSARQTGGMLG